MPWPKTDAAHTLYSGHLGQSLYNSEGCMSLVVSTYWPIQSNRGINTLILLILTFY